MHKIIDITNPAQSVCCTCGARGTLGELNRADHCPNTHPLGVEPCPTCHGMETACSDCGGFGVVTVAMAGRIRDAHTTPQKL